MRRNSRKGEIIDFTALHKRGLLSVPKQEGPKEFVDFTSSSTPVSSTPSSGFDFLQSLAGAGSTSSSSSTSPNSDVNELRIKLDDTMYKLDTVIDRIRVLEMKLAERG